MRVVEVDERLRDDAEDLAERLRLLDALLCLFEVRVEVFAAERRVVVVVLDVALDDVQGVVRAVAVEVARGLLRVGRARRGGDEQGGGDFP